MSYDFHMEIDTGGHEPTELPNLDENYTYNVSPMFREAFGGDGINQLDSTTGAECAELLRHAILKMSSDRARYEAMNPPNGWGNYEGALDLLVRLLRWCVKHPKATMRIT